jgi:predicted NAD/FAD-dependent oxidoreductase
MKRVLIIGNGLTTASIIHFLRNSGKTILPSVKVYDASLPNIAFGGRMMTDHYQVGIQVATCDLGAQYLTKYRDEANDVFDFLEGRGIIQSFKAKSGIIEGVQERSVNLPHYSVPGGMFRLVMELLGDFNSISFNTRVESIDYDKISNTIKVSSVKDEMPVEEEFDYVVSTLHAPDLTKIAGKYGKNKVFGNDRLPEKLEEIKYSSRFALGLYYHIPKPYFDRVIHPMKGKVKYIYDNPIIRYLSFEYWKNMNRYPLAVNEKGDILLSLLVHTNVQFGKDHFGYNEKALKEDQEITQMILKELPAYLPKDFPAPVLEPLRSVLKFWKYSQMTSGFSYPNVEEERKTCWIFNRAGLLQPEVEEKNHEDPLLFITGEMFTESNFEGCVEAAKTTSNHLLKLF